MVQEYGEAFTEQDASERVFEVDVLIDAKYSRTVDLVERSPF